MKKTIIAIAALATGVALAQVSVDVNIPVPQIVKLVVGNQGRVVYDLEKRIWHVDIDSVDSLGAVAPYKSAGILMEDVYSDLEALDPDTPWREKAPLLIEVIKNRAISQ